MNCNKCGAVSDETSKYCQKCGERLVQEISCAKCGKPLKPGAKFCVECGAQANPPSSVNFNRDEAGAKHQNVDADGGLIDAPNKSLEHSSKLSIGKWLFAVSIFIVYSICSHYPYFFGPGLFFIFLDLIKIFIPYFLIAAFFFDYRNETHAGWRRIYVFAQILIPALLISFLVYRDYVNSTCMNNLRSWCVNNLAHDILLSGYAEVIILLLVKISMWMRKLLPDMPTNK